MNEVERAAEVLRDWVGSGLHVRAAHDLDGKHLLRTDADRLNAELAEAYIDWRQKPGSDRDSQHRLDAAEQAILDARKPSPRFAVGNGGAGMLYTVFEVGHPTDGIVGYFPSNSAATDYAAHMNAGEAK